MTARLDELVLAAAARTPEAVAVTGGGTRLTYAELVAAAASVRAALREHGIGPGDLVGVLVDRSPNLVAGMLGVLTAGAGYVPLDPDHPAERLGFLLRDSGVRLVVCSPELAGALPPGVSPVLVGAPVSLDQSHAAPDLSPTGDDGDIAYVIYTSGSTGTPKGVVVEHRNIVSLLEATAQMFNISAVDVWSAFHSAAFDFSVWEIWGPLVSGGRVVIVPRDIARSPRDFARLVVEERVTVLNQTPTAFRGLARELTSDGRPTSLRLLIFGGERLDVRSLGPWFDCYGDEQPVVYNMYGITETTVHVTARRIARADLDGPARSPIGTALPHLTVHVLGPLGRPVPVGETGEIYVGGAGVARGYLDRPAVTAERFLPDLWCADERLYRSGDLARVLADGELDYVGRLDDQVKIRGYRVEPSESAAALMRHPQVESAIVLGSPGPDGDLRLVAYVIARGAGPAPTSADFRAFVENALPTYLVPSAYVLLERFPLTANGKLDRAALPEPGDGAPRTPAGEAPDPADEATEHLRRLGELWQKHLGVAPDPDANFFDAGGNSLLAVQMTAEANDLGLGLDIFDLFDLDTLREVAEVVASRGAPAHSPPAGSTEPEASRTLPAGVERVYPLTALQRGFLYEARAQNGAPRYFVVSSARLTNLTALSQDAAQRAAYTLASRHEVLRTTYHLAAPGEPQQWVHQHPTVLVRYLDLRAVPVAELPSRLAAERAAEAAQPLSVGSLPLWRLAVCQVADTEAEVMLSHWHTVLDGWSVVSALSQFADLLRTAAPAAKPAASYGEYVAAERTAAADPVARGFWTAALAGYRSPELPAPSAGRGLSARGVRATVELGALADDLARTAREHRVPPRTVWLAVHSAVLHALIPGASPVVITDGRLESADGVALGLFLNPVPLVRSRHAATWSDLFALTFETERTLWPFRRYPWALMRAEGAARPPDLRCCFTFADLSLGGTVHDLTETVDTGIPLHVDATPTAISVQADPVATSMDPAEMARWHHEALAAAVGQPDGPAEVKLTPAAEPRSPDGPDVAAELGLAWSEALGRPGIERTDDVRDFGATSLQMVAVAAVLEARLGVPVPTALLMRHPRPADAARALEAVR